MTIIRMLPKTHAWIEGLRTDQLLIPGTMVAVSQVLALCLVVAAVITDIAVRVRLHQNGGRLASDILVDEQNVRDLENKRKAEAEKQTEEK